MDERDEVGFEGREMVRGKEFGGRTTKRGRGSTARRELRVVRRRRREGGGSANVNS